MLKRICLRCGNEVIKSEVEGYSFQCLECDEDLYSFETELIEVEEEIEE